MMIPFWIAVSLVGLFVYILISTFVYDWLDDWADDINWTGAFWPVSVPIIGVVMGFVKLIHLCVWTRDKIREIPAAIKKRRALRKVKVADASSVAGPPPKQPNLGAHRTPMCQYCNRSFGG